MQTFLSRSYIPSSNDGQIHMMRIHPREDNFHRHAFFELVYVMHGSATHCIGTEQTVLHAGDYFIIDTGSVHCYKDISDFEIVNCLFLPEYVDRALEHCPSLSALLSNQMLRFGVPIEINAADRTCHDIDGSVQKIIESMEAEYAARRTGYMELLRCYLTQVLVYTVRSSDNAEKERDQHTATAAIVDFLQKNYTQPLSLDKLSRRLGYTPQYLSSLFHKDTGMSIQLFLQRLRVEEACRLMTKNALPVSELAQSVGYNDIKHFSRIFKKHKGISVREFKARLVK